jgi:hypothetical protein
MIKRLFFLPFLFLILFSCEKEISEDQSQYYIKMFGSYLEDKAYDMQATSDGGVIIVGSSVRETSGMDIILIKVDKYGNQASWSPKYFGTDKDDAGYSIKSIDGGYIIAGSVTVEHDGQDDKDAYIFKTDLEGNQMGEGQTFGGIYNDEALSIVEKQTGGYMFAGYRGTSASAADNTLIVTIVNDNLEDPYDTRADDNGAITQISKLSGEGYLAMGYEVLKGTGAEIGYYYAPLDEDGNFNNGVVKFDEQSGNETFSSFIVNTDNEIYTVGTLSNSSRTSKKIIVNKIIDGVISSSFTIDQSGLSDGKDITLTSNGNLVILGEKTIADNKDIVLYFTDSQGNIISSQSYGGSGNQTAESFVYGENEIVILGSNNYEGNSMITLIKTDLLGNLWE